MLTDPPAPGDNVFIRDPQSVVPGCDSITGTFVAKLADGVLMEGTIVSGELGRFSFVPVILVLRGERARSVQRQIGTPISELSGRPGRPGFDRFGGIAESWGYP